MLLYLIALLGLFMIAVGSRYSHRRLVMRGRDIDTRSILAVGAFMLVLAVILKVFNVSL